MKTNLLSLKVAAIALVAAAFLAAGPAAACIAFTVTGVLTVFLADYGRTFHGARLAA